MGLEEADWKRNVRASVLEAVRLEPVRLATFEMIDPPSLGIHLSLEHEILHLRCLERLQESRVLKR